MNFDMTGIKVSKKETKSIHLSFVCKKAMKKEFVGYDKLESETYDNNHIVIILKEHMFYMNLRYIDSIFFSTNAKKYVTISAGKKDQYKAEKLNICNFSILFQK